MLRTSLRSVRALGSRPAAAVAGRQWLPAAVRPAGVLNQRYYADEKKVAPEATKPAVIPASETNTTPATAPPPVEDTAAAASTIPAQNVPLTPPPPPPAAPALTSIPPAPKRKSFFRRLRNYVFTLTILGALAFGGGVWYSRINDNFHDFFTEYVPFGEQAVLWLEERDFKKRFPRVSDRISSRGRMDGDAVKIPAQSGASWRVASGGDSSGRQSSAVSKAEAAKDSASSGKPKQEPAPVADAKKKDAQPPKVAEPPQPKKEDEKVVPAPPPVVSEVKPGPAIAPKAAEKSTGATEPQGFKPPEVNEPSRWPPASPIDPLAVPDAVEPVVQDLVRMLNDIITVVNADGANDRYGATIGKAKNALNVVGQKIKDIKKQAEKQAADEVKSRVEEFDKAANQLIGRVEAVMAAQEVQWRQEFEGEMKALKEGYDQKLKTVVEREKQINDERVNNRLLEQAVELQRQFAAEVKKRVEDEREGRLGKLGELESAVSDLEKLTTGWNDVVDTNLRTQKLHVALDAVRASLEDAQQPRPMLMEFVALKEIVPEDPVIDAAIASINPTVYQRGVPTSTDLIERFRTVAGEVRKASLLPDDAGVASHASSWVLSHVLFKKQGLTDGNDVESILTRTQTYLEEGDLDNAAREMNGLTGWAKTLSRDWLKEVRKVLEVQQALEVIQTEARLQSLKLD